MMKFRITDAEKALMLSIRVSEVVKEETAVTSHGVGVFVCCLAPSHRILTFIPSTTAGACWEAPVIYGNVSMRGDLEVPFSPRSS